MKVTRQNSEIIQTNQELEDKSNITYVYTPQVNSLSRVDNIPFQITSLNSTLETISSKIDSLLFIFTSSNPILNELDEHGILQTSLLIPTLKIAIKDLENLHDALTEQDHNSELQIHNCHQKLENIKHLFETQVIQLDSVHETISSKLFQIGDSVMKLSETIRKLEENDFHALDLSEMTVSKFQSSIYQFYQFVFNRCICYKS